MAETNAALVARAAELDARDAGWAEQRARAAAAVQLQAAFRQHLAAKLAEELATAHALKATLDQRSGKLTEHAAALNLRATALDEREAALAEAEATVVEREERITAKEALLNEREAALLRRDTEVTVRFSCYFCLYLAVMLIVVAV